MLRAPSYLSYIVRCTLPASTLVYPYSVSLTNHQVLGHYRANGLFLEEISVLRSSIGFSLIFTQGSSLVLGQAYWHHLKKIKSHLPWRKVRQRQISETRKTVILSHFLADSIAIFVQVYSFVSEYSTNVSASLTYYSMVTRIHSTSIQSLLKCRKYCYYFFIKTEKQGHLVGKALIELILQWDEVGRLPPPNCVWPWVCHLAF